ncbi:MAG: IPT/TIG domain-containing protein [Deltaproteobacteria bacterium]|nr:IPT/TIG domain-containing protein [Deltaproteobacteria bacterium]
MRLFRLVAGLMFALVSGVTHNAFAQAPPFACGPDCSTPGRYVLCNDSYDDNNVSPGGVRLVSFLDTVCAQFAPPATTFDLVGFAALMTGGDQVATLLEVRLPTATALPGMKLFESGVGIPSAAADGFTGLFFSAVPLTSDFRICLRQQIDDPAGNGSGRGFRYDGDGFQAPNPVLVAPSPWQDASATAIAGDFILRAVVRHNDLTPWSPGGVCAGGSDAGVGNDAAPSDVGAFDFGTVPDTGEADGGVSADAQVDDVGAADSGLGDAGAIEDGGFSPLPPPTITAISPKEAGNAVAVPVVVTGGGFFPGLTLKIGPFAATEVQVPGASTITAQVPPSIAPGSYDVVVQNPDGQVAILSKGYTVLGADGTSQASSDCSCLTRGDASGLVALGLLPLLWSTRRRRPQGPAGGMDRRPKRSSCRFAGP